jgi:hypothetical protein
MLQLMTAIDTYLEHQDEIARRLRAKEEPYIAYNSLDRERDSSKKYPQHESSTQVHRMLPTVFTALWLGLAVLAVVLMGLPAPHLTP